MSIRATLVPSVLLACLLGCLLRPATAEEPAVPQIIGGSAIPSGMFPFVVALLNEYDAVICSGSLIRPGWVITAAHCGEPAGVLISDARPGGRGSGHDVWSIAVESWTPHPQYSAAVFPFVNDIALVKIGSSAPDVPPTMNDVPLYTPAPISLATGPGSTSASIGDVLIAGFGFDDPDEEDPPPNIAHWAHGVPTAGAADCDIDGVSSTQNLCYGPSPNACSGDSGGPVFQYNDGAFELFGIVSVGVDGAPCASFHDAATYVPAYLEWIDSTISPPGSNPITLGWELPADKVDGITSGIANGQGWTFSSAGSIPSVELFVDGLKEATLPCCSERGDAPGPILSGFAGVISWGRFSPGDHAAALVVRDSAGNEKTETRTITTVRTLSDVAFARDLSFADATCSTTDDELACTGLEFTQGTCDGEMRFRWLNGKQGLEVSQGCPD